jgi:alkanesulfonate monooxygenase SsuD/methylene tetrahydromethanopterin reductase-like flavin-dependent oxidoreductase (luciferase family)
MGAVQCVNAIYAPTRPRGPGQARAQRAAISDAFIEDLCAIGTPQDVAAGVARYRAAGATNPMITNITGTDLRPTLQAAVAA